MLYGYFFIVRETREAAIDSGIVALISQLAKQQVQALHTDFCVFEPAEFGEKLVSDLRFVLVLLK